MTAACAASNMPIALQENRLKGVGPILPSPSRSPPPPVETFQMHTVPGKDRGEKTKKINVGRSPLLLLLVEVVVVAAELPFLEMLCGRRYSIAVLPNAFSLVIQTS